VLVDLFVIGAGYVGLTTAVGFSELGHRVTVHDIDPVRVTKLASGRAPFLEEGLEDALARGLAADRLTFTNDPHPALGTRLVIVAVPTPTRPDSLLDSSLVESVVRRLTRELDPEATIVIRSTLPLDAPARLAAIGGPGGGPAILVNPEFLREGHALADFAEPSRVVVGFLRPAEREAAEAFARLYEPLGAPVMVADAASVVLVKFASNVFLSTKIAFVNELARLCDVLQADVSVVADGIGSDPRIGRAFLDSGPGFGGSCLPEQATAMAVEVTRHQVTAPLLGSVGRSNDVHQQAIATAVGALLPGGLAGARIAILGLAFKADTDDIRQSPAIAVAGHLRDLGADLVAYDPVVRRPTVPADLDLAIAETATDAITGADAVLVVTDWSEFRALDWASLGPAMRGDLVYDTRRCIDGAAVRAGGLRYAALGKGVVGAGRGMPVAALSMP
jgi:UDPglucose 6-dehydrogenase